MYRLQNGVGDQDALYNSVLQCISSFRLEEPLLRVFELLLADRSA
jgi:hypothetical protein